MDNIDINDEIARHEEGLINTLKNKVKLLENSLVRSQAEVESKDDEIWGLKSQFEHNLQVIAERDEDLKELKANFEKVLRLNSEKNELINENDREWSQRLETIEHQLSVKNLELKDVYEKQKEFKRELAFYKKGYLEEVGNYKQIIAQKEKEVEAYRIEIERIKKDEMGEIEKRMETRMEELRESNERMLRQMRDEGERRQRSDKLLLEERDNALARLVSDNDKLSSENRRMALESEKSKAEIDQLKITVSNDRHREYKEFKDKEMDLAKQLAVLQHKYELVQIEHEKQAVRLSKLKEKHVSKVSELQSSYEYKIVEIVTEYRKELTDKVY